MVVMVVNMEVEVVEDLGFILDGILWDMEGMEVRMEVEVVMEVIILIIYMALMALKALIHLHGQM